MGAKIGAAVTLVIWGVIFANVLAHPAGTKAASDATVNIINPPLGALLGKAP